MCQQDGREVASSHLNIHYPKGPEASIAFLDFGFEEVHTARWRKKNNQMLSPFLHDPINHTPGRVTHPPSLNLWEVS